MKITAEADPGPNFYYAVIRNEARIVISHCPHHHKTREAAEKCATTWLLVSLQ